MDLNSTPRVHSIPSVRPADQSDSIVDFVVGDPDLTLWKLFFAGLVFGTGSPLSVCPEQQNFADVPTAIVEQLFLDGNFIPQLQDLLFLHLLPGAFSTAALMLLGSRRF
jgi:hypothetical protein